MTKTKKPILSTFDIKYYDSLPSTNTLARQHAIEGAPEGLVIVADHQSKGRGQGSNTWESPAGKNLLFSLLIRPELKPNKAAFLTQLACQTLAKILESHGIKPTLKMPNDILVGDKKICGVLVEAMTSSKNKVESAVIGVGLNVNAERRELIETGTSMKVLLGTTFDRKILLNEILRQFQADLQKIT